MVYTVTTTSAQDLMMDALLANLAKAGTAITAAELIQMWATHPLRARLQELQQRLAIQRQAKIDAATADIQAQVKPLQDQIDALVATVQAP